jgi:asparagine synthase (glutamine-hydrolysing)
MRDTMVHRGPDGAGLWIADDSRVGFGHRRLSIVDLSDAAAQPMRSIEGDLCITFNGEIYNHREIRAELVALGRCRWQTDHSDTEVILQAFAQWGIECVHKFRGMFAFALWDANSRKLWLVRDRIGIKPLYYSIHHGRLTFASEIKALLKDPDQPRNVNEQSLFHYLSFLTTPPPHTLFAGISKLPGGTYLTIDERGVPALAQYWDVWDRVTPFNGYSDAEIAQRVLQELRTSVHLHKVGDVPVGVFLSGGIDSSTNAALFSEDEAEPVRTFTVGYDRDYKSYASEIIQARWMAQKIGARHEERRLKINDLIDFLPSMVRLQDEPIADPVCVPVYYVAKLAREAGVIVCQVGEGADELFWGYPSWKIALQLERWNQWPVPRTAKRMGLALIDAVGKGDGMPYERLRRGVDGLPVFWGGAEAFTEREKQRFLSVRLKSQFKGLTSWEALRPIHERFIAHAWEKTPLQWMTYVDLKLRLPELLLMRVDKMAMGASLEGRVPFLDHGVIELAMSIPEAVKTRNHVLKAVLKNAVRGVIPDEVIDRPKQGFGVPMQEWWTERLSTLAGDVMRTFLNETDFFDSKVAMSFIKESGDPRGWYLLNCALWWNEYIAST